MHCKELLLNAGEGPPTLQSTVIPPWNYAPQLPGKVTPTSSPIVNATRKWKRTCTGFTRISPGSPQDRHKRDLLVLERILEDLSWYKNLPRASHKRFHTSTSAKTFHRMSSGSSQHLLARMSTRPWSRSSQITDLWGKRGQPFFASLRNQKCTWTYQKGPFQQKKKINGNAADHDRAAHLVRACAVEMHTEISQGTFVREFTMKSQGPQSVPGSNTGL